MIIWKLVHPEMTIEHLGLLIYMLDDRSPDRASKQLDRNYRQGGGWTPFQGFRLNPDNSLSYPGDPDNEPLAETKLREELIVFYRFSWVAVIQPDRSFEICRMD